MRYPEWSDRTLMVDLRNRIAKCYKNDDGSLFYVEPGFYKAYEALKNIYPDRIQDVLNRMDEIVKKNRKVVFVSEEENPWSKSKGRSTSRSSTSPTLSASCWITLKEVTGPIRQIFLVHFFGEILIRKTLR